MWGLHKMTIFSSTQKTTSKFYQPGVDGLRALAVLIVLFFHAGINLFPGGYVGVDVFFVISGYLITGIIVRANDDKKFDIISFFLSRVSRLYPTLIVVTFTTLLAALFIYSTTDLKLIMQSAKYALASLSNVYFANSAGYFDKSSEINPFLHTWSLAVEQQFYLIWPFIILLLSKLNRKLMPVCLMVLTVILTMASAWSIKHMPIQGYYWAIFRFFELSAGGALFFSKKHIPNKNLIKEILLSIGLILIVYCALFFNSQTAFPGLNALIPVIGAMLCIIACDAKITGKTLRNKFSVGIGLISYSIYLIHWPLIVLYKYYVYRELTFVDKAFIVTSSIVGAYVLYDAVENRFRRINFRSFNKVSCAFVCSIVITLSMSTMETFTTLKPKDSSLTNNVNYVNSITYGGDGINQGANVPLGSPQVKPSFVIMGDSFARQYANSINSNLNINNKSAIGFFADGCFYSYFYSTKTNNIINTKCHQMLIAATKYARENSLPLIFAQQWSAYRWTTADDKSELMRFKNQSAYASFVVKNINNITIKSGVKEVILIGDLPQSPGVGGSASCLSRPSFSRSQCIDHLTINEEDNVSFNINNTIAELTKTSKIIHFINPYNFICEEGKCRSFSKEGLSMYSDNVHLSKYGASLITPLVLSSFFSEGVKI